MIDEISFGDCMELMNGIPTETVDMILCDLPYGVTKNPWDAVIDFGGLWLQYERIIKPTGAIVLTAQDKFSAKLMLSNERLHRYNLIWEKTSPSGYLNANKMPLRNHEDILVFYKQLPTYNPQKTVGHERKISTAKHKRNSTKTSNYGEHELSTYDSTERYPRSVLLFASDVQKSALHPTQKPVALFEYLIRTYTNEGEIVLDNCSGSGTTAIACLRANRKYICIENDRRIYDDSVRRIWAWKRQPMLNLA